jgi:ketosteroid isomerase-like protein
MKAMKPILIFCFLLGFASCQESSRTAGTSGSLNAIQDVMDAQQESWNRGDLEGFMQGYWKSDSLRFIGKRGITFGWQQTLDNYKKGYPDTNAMGRLQFTNISLEITGDSCAYVIGKWELFRTNDTLGGHYSLLWKNLNGMWLIVADHSS